MNRLFSNIYVRQLFFYCIIMIAVLLHLRILFSQSLRLDEAQALWIATKSIDTIFKTSIQNLQMPLYLLVLHYWVWLFGSNIIVVRLLSLLLFLATIVYLYALAKRTTNDDVAVITIVLFSFSPFIIWYSNEAWMYTLFTLVTCMNHVYFLIMYKTNAIKGKNFYFVSSILGLFTHIFFLSILISQLAFVILMALRKRVSRAFLFWYISLFILVMISASILVKNIFVQGIPQIQTFARAQNVIQIFINFLFGFPNSTVQSFIVSLWPLVTMILLFIFTRRKAFHDAASQYFGVVSFFPILIVYALSYISPVFLARNLIFVTPTLFLLIALLIWSVTKKFFSWVTVSILFCLFLLYVTQRSSQYTTVQEDYQAVTAYIAAKAQPTDIIVVSPPFTVYPIEYYNQKLIKIDTIPLWNSFSNTPIPTLSQKSMAAQIARYKKTYGRMYVIISDQDSTAIKVKYYLDTHYERVEQKEFPSQITLAVYRLRYDINEVYK